MGRLIEFPDTGTPRAGRPLWRHVLGEVLRGERLEQERILTEVAQSAGVSPQYLSEVERGRKEASSEVLGAVADALGLELVDVVGRVAGRLGAAGVAERRPGTRSPAVPVAAPLVLDLPDSAPAGGLGTSRELRGARTDAFLLAA